MAVPSQTCKQNVSQSEANMIEEFREAVAKRGLLAVGAVLAWPIVFGKKGHTR